MSSNDLTFTIPGGPFEKIFDEDFEDNDIENWLNGIPLHLYVVYRCRIADNSFLFYRIISGYKDEWIGDGNGYNSGSIIDKIENVMDETGDRKVTVTAEEHILNTLTYDNS